MVGRDWCGAGGLARPAERQGEWLLGAAEGTLGLIGGPAGELCVAVGEAIAIRIAYSNTLWLQLVGVGVMGLL